MSRSASSANMGAPNSPRTGSRRGPSRRGGEGAKEAQAAKTMPLTAGQDLKPITVSASGWKPASLVGKGASAAAPTGNGNMDPEMVQRKVKANLNKMTPEKFDKIADQILTIAAQSKNESDGRTLRQVIQLTFEKATDEAHWASMYAKFCKRMLDTMSPEIRDETLKDKNGEVVCGGALFRKYLLNRCQEEFERGWKTNLPEKPAEEDSAKPATGEAAMLSEEYYIAAAAKRRGLGLVQFIGELYKLGMLTERIMHACVQKLVDYAQKTGLTLVMLTLTSSHDLETTLKAQRRMMKKAKGSLTTRAGFKKGILPRLVGSVTATEVTHGRFSGWHLHFHYILLVNLRDFPPDDREEEAQRQPLGEVPEGAPAAGPTVRSTARSARDRRSGPRAGSPDRHRTS